MKNCVVKGYAQLRFLLFVLLALATYLSQPALGKTPVPSYDKEMQQIIKQLDISHTEKIVRLRPYLQHDDSRMSALQYMSRVEKSAARDAAIALFRKETTTQTEKLRLGRFLLSSVYPGKFLNEYAKFLTQAVLIGEKEFTQTHEMGSYTAIGEYAYIAAGFNGYRPAYFDKMKDKRVIPILIRCLNAADDVWPKNQGDLIRGKPGKSTGRNIARQNIPIALARLGATTAIPALQDILRTHKDHYLRKNAAESLAVLTMRK